MNWMFCIKYQFSYFSNTQLSFSTCELFEPNFADFFLIVFWCLVLLFQNEAWFDLILSLWISSSPILGLWWFTSFPAPTVGLGNLLNTKLQCQSWNAYSLLLPDITHTFSNRWPFSLYLNTFSSLRGNLFYCQTASFWKLSFVFFWN